LLSLQVLADFQQDLLGFLRIEAEQVVVSIHRPVQELLEVMARALP
jgi:hypothetical protein